MKYDIEKILEEYNIRKSNAKPLIDEVKYRISQATTKEHIKIHHIFDRIKGFDSFLDKIKRKKLSDPFNEVHDLIGFRIICLFLEDTHKIGDLLMKEFDVFDKNDKIEDVRYDVFGYMSSHYKAKLQNSDIFTDIARNYIFEIQVRTIAQDAWASISHYLFYKQETQLPDNLRRDFHAVSGLFYIADTHFSLLQNEQLKHFIDLAESG
jgi:ppGpp synthetase/RelA/SpoT-type nucleotidyltranferase